MRPIPRRPPPSCELRTSGRSRQAFWTLDSSRFLYVSRLLNRPWPMRDSPRSPYISEAMVSLRVTVFCMACAISYLHPAACGLKGYGNGLSLPGKQRRAFYMTVSCPRPKGSVLVGLPHLLTPNSRQTKEKDNLDKGNSKGR